VGAGTKAKSERRFLLLYGLVEKANLPVDLYAAALAMLGTKGGWETDRFVSSLSEVDSLLRGSNSLFDNMP
jgi:hypothetical protein